MNRGLYTRDEQNAELRLCVGDGAGDSSNSMGSFGIIQIKSTFSESTVLIVAVIVSVSTW